MPTSIILRTFRFPLDLITASQIIHREDPKHPWPNIAFFCPVCGATYATVTHTPQRSGSDPWIAWRNSCDTCPPAWDGMVPGSLLTLPEIKQDINNLPEAVIKREFHLLTERAYDAAAKDTIDE